MIASIDNLYRISSESDIEQFVTENCSVSKRSGVRGILEKALLQTPQVFVFIATSEVPRGGTQGGMMFGHD